MPVVCQRYPKAWDTSVNKTYKSLSPHGFAFQGDHLLHI